MTPPRCLEALAATRARLGDEVPLIPMTYAAIVERYGVARFCADAASAGATGLIVADVPPDDGDELQAESARNGIDLVQLVALTSADARLALACRVSRGFIYVVSAIGTTGAREELDVERLRGLLARVRAHAGELPLLCGFGVSRARAGARSARGRRRRRDRRLGRDRGARERRRRRARRARRLARRRALRCAPSVSPGRAASTARRAP